MAGVTLTPTILDQLRLMGWLRWRLFVNALRTTRGKAELASRIILSVLIGSAVLGFGLGLGVASWYAISSRKPVILSGELWLVFVVWLVWPILISGFGAESDPASLLRFPLRYSTFALVAFAHGIFDPVSVAALYCLLAILAGIAFASTGALAWAIPAVALFALFNLLLNRTIFAWLSRWLAQRRTREILGIVFLLMMFSFQLIGPLAERYGKRALPVVSHLASASRVLPPGLAASAITAGNAARPTRAMAESAGLLAYCAVLGWLLFIRLRAEYRGECLSETAREASGARAAVHAGWSVAGLSPTVAALLEKDLRYLRRNTIAYFNLLAPLLVVVLLSLNRSAHHRHQAFWQSSSIFFPMSVGYVIISLANFLYNTLGYDGPGLPMLLAAPVRFRDVLAAKNLLYSMIFVVEVFAVFVLVQFVAGPTPPLVAAVTLAAALWAFLTNLAAGNLASLYFPSKLNFGQMRRQQSSGISVAVNLGIQVLLLGLAGGMYFLLVLREGHPAWCGALFLVLAGVAWAAYRRVLEASSNIALRRREVLMAELSRPG